MEHLNAYLALMEGWYATALVYGNEALAMAHDAQEKVLGRLAETFGPEWVTDLYAAGEASVHALLLWLKVVTPMARAAAQYLWATPEAMITVVALLFFWLLYRHIRRRQYFKRLSDAISARLARVQARYNAGIESLRTRSRFAALFLPHIVYAFVVVMLCQIGFFRSLLSSTSTYRVFAYIAPTIFSTLAAAEATPNRERVRFWVQYWCVYCFFSALMQVPFASTVLGLVPYMSIVYSATAIWLVMPLLEGTKVACNMVIPLISRNFITLPTEYAQQQQKSVVLNMLASFGIISARTREVLGQVLSDLVVVVLGVGFFCSPGFVTYYGCLVVGYVYPVFKSLRELGDTAATDAVLQQRLVYWVVIVQFFAAHAFFSLILDILPFWYHLKLVAVLWLQLPYFEGARRVFASVAPALIEGAAPVVARAQTRLIEMLTPRSAAAPRPVQRTAAAQGTESAVPPRLRLDDASGAGAVPMTPLTTASSGSLRQRVVLANATAANATTGQEG